MLAIYFVLFFGVIVSDVIFFGDAFRHREAEWDKTVHTAEATLPGSEPQENKR